jgi:hypothetical protein
MRIEEGDFICMWKTGSPREWWLEVMLLLPLSKVKADSEQDQQYQVRTWKVDINDWHYFYLAPNTYHKGMVKEVRKIPPEVAPMFRDLFMKGVAV